MTFWDYKQFFMHIFKFETPVFSIFVKSCHNSNFYEAKLFFDKLKKLQIKFCTTLDLCYFL